MEKHMNPCENISESSHSSSRNEVTVAPKGDCHPFLHWVSAALFWTLSLIVFSQFISRYVLNDSIAWSEEVARYFLIVVCFLSCATTMARNNHVRVEFFYRFFSVTVARKISFIVDFGSVVFIGYLSFLCFKLAGRTNQMMTSLDISKDIVYYSAAISLLLMTFYAAGVMISHLRKGDSELTAVSASVVSSSDE